MDKDNDGATDRCKKIASFVRRNILLLSMLVAIILGIALGIGLRALDPPMSKRNVNYLKFPGDLLLNMLKMMILPLVVSSLISGMASLDLRATGRMGLRTIIYYISTTVIAVIVGIILVLSIRPGLGTAKSDLKATGRAEIVNAADSFLDLIRNMFPENLVTATFEKAKTKQIPQLVKVKRIQFNCTGSCAKNLTNSIHPNCSCADNLANSIHPNCSCAVNVTEATNSNTSTLNGSTDKIEYIPQLTKSPGINTLGIIVFSIFFGAVIAYMRERGQPLVDFFTTLNEAVMILVSLVIWYSPLGIMFLIAAKVVAMEDAEESMARLGKYIGTVLAGLVIHGYLILPGIYLIVVRKNPYRFIYNMIGAIITALGTASSAATLPVTMRNLKELNRVDERVTKFMTPIGATINMDGTALYEAVASIFIAQINGIYLDFGQVVTVSITATLAAIGAAGVPQAGLVTMVIVLSAVGLPADDVTLILAVDWFLDRCRTSVNVLGDAFGAGIVEHLSSAELKKMDAAEALALTNGGFEVDPEVISTNM